MNAFLDIFWVWNMANCHSPVLYKCPILGQMLRDTTIRVYGLPYNNPDIIRIPRIPRILPGIERFPTRLISENIRESMYGAGVLLMIVDPSGYR